MVANNDLGKSIKSEVRTSSGMFLSKAQLLQHSNRIHDIGWNLSMHMIHGELYK
ncbi:hypothetical protein Sjap_024177 [Stephania japonica]|uniref:Uncharacterized protein n=1 Tax=Stephania japonica TaxID=461633 RepID=A0AAP0ECY7_9MAGN